MVALELVGSGQLQETLDWQTEVYGVVAADLVSGAFVALSVRVRFPVALPVAP